MWEWKRNRIFSWPFFVRKSDIRNLPTLSGQNYDHQSVLNEKKIKLKCLPIAFYTKCVHCNLERLVKAWNETKRANNPSLNVWYVYCSLLGIGFFLAGRIPSSLCIQFMQGKHWTFIFMKTEQFAIKWNNSNKCIISALWQPGHTKKNTHTHHTNRPNSRSGISMVHRIHHDKNRRRRADLILYSLLYCATVPILASAVRTCGAHTKFTNTPSSARNELGGRIHPCCALYNTNK